MSSPAPTVAPSSFVVTAGEAGQRLDKVVARRYPALARAGVGRLTAAGAVLVDGRRAARGLRCRAGCTVTIHADLDGSAREDHDSPLDLRLLRDDLVVAHKPRGVPSVPLHGAQHPTLAGALLARFPEMRGIGRQPLDAGLVHRLDTGTSGLLVAARTRPAFERLARASSTGHLVKRYLAVVPAEGLQESGRIESRLGPGPRGRVVVDGSARGRPVSVTRWRRLELWGDRALIEVEAGPAYRHQVRVHLASIGHPIAGDLLYGGEPIALDAGFALHASYVAWEGDDQLPGFAAAAPLPEALRRALRLG